jgi:hypothetical protein
MNPLKPLKVFTDAITMPFTALFVIGLTYTINMMTSPHHMWFQWAAMGMIIAVIAAWVRALKALAIAMGVAGVAGLVWYGLKKARKSNAFNSASSAAR